MTELRARRRRRSATPCRRPSPITRADLVRYAGASGDFNSIHWNERVAREVGLPDVIAHGMLTMALAGRVLTDWAGDPAALVEYGVRFTGPWSSPTTASARRSWSTGVVKDELEDGLRPRGPHGHLRRRSRCSARRRAVVRLA